MEDEAVISRPEERKHKLRCDIAAWQKAAVGLLVLLLAVNLFGGAYIAQERRHHELELESLRLDVEAANAMRDQAVTLLGAAERDKQFALDELAEITRREQERQAQAEAYAALEGYQYLGECEITAYCACAECCGKWADGYTATGLELAPGMCAVDPEVVPLGSTVIIDGQRYLAADTGVTGNHIDIAVMSHNEAQKRGTRQAEVWVVEEGKHGAGE